MDIVPNLTRDDLSKERIEYQQKQQHEYKLVNRVKKNGMNDQDITAVNVAEKEMG